MWIMVCVSRHCRDIPRQEYRDLERILSHTYCMINTRETITPSLLLLSSDAPALNMRCSELLREPVHSFQSFSFAHTPLLILTDKGNLNTPPRMRCRWNRSDFAEGFFALDVLDVSLGLTFWSPKGILRWKLLITESVLFLDAKRSVFVLFTANRNVVFGFLPFYREA